MAALTAARQTEQMLPGKRSYGQKGSTKIYQHSLVMLELAGSLLRPGAVATGCIGVGRACSNGGLPSWDNSAGSDSDLKPEFEEGIFKWANGDSIVAGDVEKPCFILDDQTVTKGHGSGARSFAGIIVKVDSDGVWVKSSVEIGRAYASAASAYTQTYSTANRTVANPTSAALTDNSGGAAADGTIAAVTLPGALTDNGGGGAADGTIAAITGDQTVKDAVTELATKANSANTAISALRDAVKELSDQVNKLVADDTDNRQTLTALIDDLQAAGIIA